MKIAYFIYWLDGYESGVVKKITAQISYWQSKGNEVKLFIFTKENSLLDKDVKKLGNVFEYEIELHSHSGKLDQLTRSYDVYKAINTYSPNIVYMRECKLYPGIYKLNKKFPTVIEINSIKSNEVNKKSIAYWYNKLTSYHKFKNLKAFVTVTKEIATHKTISKFSAPKYIIANGLDLDNNYELLEAYKKEINLVFIGTDGQKWHGVDKIMHLAKQKKDWKFHIIGISNNYEKLDNVKFYGELTKKEYEVIYSFSDVAIGTLALYRKGMEEACPLKTREYLAYGLPIIIGYEDVDFPEKYDFICQLENDKTNVSNNYAKIEEFVNFWQGKRIDKQKIKHLDVSYKENKRLEVFNKYKLPIH